MIQTIDYMTVIEKVREVTIHGLADLAPWQAFLADEAFPPFSSDGKAQLLISAVDAKYMGIRFQELSFSVATTSSTNPLNSNGYFLAHAFNSRPLFAMAERRFFQTPYYPAKIDFDTHNLRLSKDNTILFEITLSQQSSCLAKEYRLWEGTIHLPKALRKKQNLRHYFHARLEGNAEIYNGNVDSIHINSIKDIPVLDVLEKSNLTVNEWHVRANGKHSKSKTYIDS